MFCNCVLLTPPHKTGSGWGARLCRDLGFGLDWTLSLSQFPASGAHFCSNYLLNCLVFGNLGLELYNYDYETPVVITSFPGLSAIVEPLISVPPLNETVALGESSGF